MGSMTFEEFDARRDALLARGERINAKRMGLELTDEHRKIIMRMVDEIQDRLDDLVPEFFPALRDIDSDHESENDLVEMAFGLVYNDFMRQMRNETDAD